MENNSYIQSISENNDWDFYYNRDVKAQNGFFLETKEYFETSARKGFLEPLLFANLFWKQLDYFIAHTKTPHSTLLHFEGLLLTPEQKHVLYGFILKYYGGYSVITDIDGIQMATALLLIEEAFLRYEGDTPEKEYCRNTHQPKNLNDKLISLEPLPESYQYTAKDFEGFAANYDWDFYHNLQNVSNQTLLIFPIKKYFQTGERAGFIEPLSFMNLLWKQKAYFKENLDKIHTVVTHLKTLPFNEEIKHILFGMLLKWHSGYPINREYFGNNDQQRPGLLLIEREFLSYEGNTPEKWFCLKEEEKQRRIEEANAKLDAKINREKSISQSEQIPESPTPQQTENEKPAPVAVSDEDLDAKKVSKNQEHKYKQIAISYENSCYHLYREYDYNPQRNNQFYDKTAINLTIDKIFENGIKSLSGKIIKRDKPYSQKTITDALKWVNENKKK